VLTLNLDLRKASYLRVPKSEGVERADDSKIKKGANTKASLSLYFSSLRVKNEMLKLLF
jgi:hypothetical protein